VCFLAEAAAQPWLRDGTSELRHVGRFTNQVMAQIELHTNCDAYECKVPRREAGRESARYTSDKLGVKLNEVVRPGGLPRR